MRVFTTACLWTPSFASWSCTPGHTISLKSVLEFSFHLCHELCLPRGTFLLWISRRFSALYRPMSHPFPSPSSHNWNNTSATNSLYMKMRVLRLSQRCRWGLRFSAMWHGVARYLVPDVSRRRKGLIMKGPDVGNNYPVTRLHISEDKVFSYKVTHYVRV
jgi:hypothetical protein